MTRAVRILQVTRRGVTVRVRVLPTVDDVHRAYRSGKARRLRQRVHGVTSVPAGAHVARMTLPLAGWTPGLVAHEVVHVADSFGFRDMPDDEPEATFVGEMTDSICARLARLEKQCA